MNDTQSVLRSDLNRSFAGFGIILCLGSSVIGLMGFGLLVASLFAQPSLGAASIVTVAVSLGLTAFGLAAARAGAVTAGDLMLPRPLLQIDEAGITDRRLGCGTVPWSDIAEIASLDPEQAGLLIRLRNPRTARFSRFRAGALGVVWRLPPSTIYVPMQRAMGPRVAPGEIFAIAQRHGVKTVAQRISILTSRSVPVGN